MLFNVKRSGIGVVTMQDLTDYRKHYVFLEQQTQKLKQWNDQWTRIKTSSSISRSNDTDIKKAYSELESNIKKILVQTAQSISDLHQKEQEIEETLSHIPNPDIRAVMYQRYVLGADCNDLAALLGISRRSVYRLHKLGCDYIEKLRHCSA